ncbi:branched-chain amino acid ABC transporter substrate-binding protein [Dictyobacter aurantiacus]|uniref:Branched chain amino acid ABC transporter substrate-binding protein n=1 Tax=Dictyobacter aurantiacus TaxID=1936993 RepID=A0A401ZMM9_9CHLR|nr:branched-chain amino acid ABC transporter substrate-binding protein [Dictyobacter aurantiacus]GCE08108.1 branched chain amino acid ABC transporter substrate-binding protein [Dictyobacter aurantiacus]
MKKSRVQMITLLLTITCLTALLSACSTSSVTAHPAPGSTVSGSVTHFVSTSETAQHRQGNILNTQKKKPTIIKIGLDLPLSGTDASLGQSAENGALLAISQANATNMLPGYKLQLVAKDDTNASGVPDGTKSADNVNALTNDAQVAGIIGAFDTTTAEAELPLTNKASLALLSPSATYACLTQADTAAGCGTLSGTLRPTGKTTFFRLAPTDVQQGEAQADFAIHYKTVYVIDDTSAYGTALASGFISKFQANFGIIVGHTSAAPAAEYINLLTQIAALRPDAIFYAGGDAEGTTIRMQMGHIPGLFNTPFLGGNGIHTTTFASAIAPLGGGLVYSTAPAIVPTTGTFVQQYQASYGTPGTYSAAGYDSVNILLAALKTAIAHKAQAPVKGNQAKAALAFRQKVVGGVAQTSYTSVTGLQYTFTANGDALNNTIEVDVLSSAAQWNARTTVQETQGQ